MSERKVRTGWRAKPGVDPGVRSVRGHRRSPRTVAQYEVFLRILQAAEGMQQGVNDLLKLYDLTAAQYNVLRILRGADAEGLPCQLIADRLIRKDPDVTRLLDRLERRGLIARARDGQDRRVVRTRITADGLQIVNALDQPVDDLHEEQLGHLTAEQLRELGGLLARARERLP
jgi:DNA-binding MarR family transcriptional regulator